MHHYSTGSRKIKNFLKPTILETEPSGNYKD